MDHGFLMEVCVDSVESAVNAERGGEARGPVGGSGVRAEAGCVTASPQVPAGSSCARGWWREEPPRAWVSTASPAPLRNRCVLLEVPPPSVFPCSSGLLQVVKQCVRVPVFVMIRPRGGDFLYSDREVEVMKADIRLAKLHGADGLVFGALTEDGRIDTELCTALLGENIPATVCRPLPVTFHRAFDMVHDPQVALETLISLGFERVLTSGCDSSALEGLSLIKKLAEQAKGRIVVVPVTSHFPYRNPNVAMGASFSAPEYSVKVADVAKVRTLNAIAKNIL
ncbi:UNVERIFIED_CONTAM: hypothetical protein H355_016540 [Colinus virginianus]|nr:hypothetical protein H355_016540 [Colinus virginianus]